MTSLSLAPVSPPSQPYTGGVIRPAVEGDIPALCLMGARFVQAHYGGLVEANPEAMAKTARFLLSDGLLLVAEKDGEPIGMIGAACFDHPISGQRTCGELFWWCNPEARGVGVKLFIALKKWARKKRAVSLQMVAPNARVGKFYSKLGFTCVEYAYQREL